jgi:uncharacterized membrane protein YphA (DoxX/SURF4 family)
MKKIIENRILFIVFRIFIGFIFIYAGFDKILNPAGFAESIANYRILPEVAIHLFAVVLPWIEFFAGLFLILGLFVHGSSLLLLGLLVIFTLAISISLFRGIDISCGCRTPWEAVDRISFRKLIEEIMYIFLTLQIFWHTTHTLCLDALLARKK